MPPDQPYSKSSLCILAMLLIECVFQEGVLESIDQGIRDGRIDAEKCERQLKTLRWELTRH